MKMFFLICVFISTAAIADLVPMRFCGLRLGQQLPEGIEPTSKTEMFYGYNLPVRETILKFNNYQFHASLITRTVTSAGAGYTTSSKRDAEELFADACRWLEQKYPGKRCEDFKSSNRTIKVMRFGDEEDGGYYMLEIMEPMHGTHVVLIALYNYELSQIQECEAKQFASRKMVGQAAPIQFNLQQVNNSINQGKTIRHILTNSLMPRSSSLTNKTIEEKTKVIMRNIREVIEAYQKRNKTRSAPEDIKKLKSALLGSGVIFKDGWGSDFIYCCQGDRWTLCSIGQDRRYGTADDLIYICEDGLNVTEVGYPTGNGVYLDTDVVNQNKALRDRAGENIGGRQDGWTQIEIPSFLTVDIPPTLELQKGLCKALKEAIAKVSLKLDLRSQALTLQPAGLNDLVEGSTRRYARIIFKSVFDKDGDFDMPHEELTPDVMKNIEDAEYEELKKIFDQMRRSGISSAKIIKWYPIRKVRLGGLEGYRTAVLRQQGSNPPVYVEEYKLGDGRYLHSVVFSYRQNEASFWESDYAEIKTRIRFKTNER